MVTKIFRLIKTHYLLLLTVVFFAVSYSFWTVTKHNHFQTDAVDLGIFDQVIWKYSQFKAPLSSVKFNTFPGMNILGDHFHLLIAVFAPLFWVWDDVRAILIGQVVVVVMSVIPIYLLALTKLRSILVSFLISLNYLIFIGLQTLLDYDFHEIALALPLLSLGIYLLEKRRFRAYVVVLFLSFLVKEDMPLVMATLGIWAMLKLRLLKIGLLTLGISALVYWLIAYQIIPYFKHEAFDYEHLDPSLGKTGLDLIKTFVTNPFLVVKTAFYDAQWIKARTIFNLLQSYLFLPLLSPSSLVMLIPNIVSRFLTELPQRWIIRFQYSAIWDPILAVGTIYALDNISGLLARVRSLNKHRFGIILGLCVLMLLNSIYVTKKINGPLTERVFNPKFYEDREDWIKNRILLSQIPKNSSVMVQTAFVPHLSHRDKVYGYDFSVIRRNEQVDYILMSLEEHNDPPYLREDLEKRILELKGLPNYEVISWDGKRLFMRKKS